jgi:hypothetical protein
MSDNMERPKVQKSEMVSEKSEMSCVDFTQHALRNRIAPPNVGSVKARIRHASRKLGWSGSRVKDCWYADPRISIGADELRAVEQFSGLHYGRQELQEIDAYIARSTALLHGQDEDFHGAFAAAMRAFFRALAGPGTEG